MIDLGVIFDFLIKWLGNKWVFEKWIWVSLVFFIMWEINFGSLRVLGVMGSFYLILYVFGMCYKDDLEWFLCRIEKIIIF